MKTVLSRTWLWKEGDCETWDCSPEPVCYLQKQMSFKTEQNFLQFSTSLCLCSSCTTSKSLPCSSVFSCTVHIPFFPFLLSSSMSVGQWIERMRVLVSRGQGCSTSPRFRLFLLSSPLLLQLVKAVVFLLTNTDVSPYQHQVSTDSEKVMQLMNYLVGFP